MKNSNIQNYFRNAQDEVNNTYFSADGFDDFSADADFQYADDETGDDLGADGDFEEAAGQQRRSAPQKSSPFVINIDNTNITSNATNVVIFNMANALWIAPTNEGYGNGGDIVISMGYAGSTYREMLLATSSVPFIVGLTLLQGISLGTGGSAQAQTSSSITLTETLANGKKSDTPLLFYPDIYQNQTNIVANRSTFKIDTFLKATISTVYANTRCQLTFYPSESASLTRNLAGKQPIRKYGNPKVIGAQTLNIRKG
jgi:hypothetical protein